MWNLEIISNPKDNLVFIGKRLCLCFAEMKSTGFQCHVHVDKDCSEVTKKFYLQICYHFLLSLINFRGVISIFKCHIF